MIFLILCLITFAALSLSSAQSDYKFSQRLAERKTSYYAASNTAEEILGSIDELLVQTYSDSNDDYFSHLEEELESFYSSNNQNAVTLMYDFSSEPPSVTYMVPIDAKQSLCVKLEITPPEAASDSFYRICQWEIIPLEKWQADNALNLIPLP